MRKFSLTIAAATDKYSVEPAGTEFEAGTKVKLTALPGPDEAFIGWGGDISSDEQTIVLTMDKDLLIFLSFGSKVQTEPVIDPPAVDSGDDPFSDVDVPDPSDLDVWNDLAIPTPLGTPLVPGVKYSLPAAESAPEDSDAPAKPVGKAAEEKPKPAKKAVEKAKTPSWQERAFQAVSAKAGQLVLVGLILLVIAASFCRQQPKEEDSPTPPVAQVPVANSAPVTTAAPATVVSPTVPVPATPVPIPPAPINYDLSTAEGRASAFQEWAVQTYGRIGDPIKDPRMRTPGDFEKIAEAALAEQADKIEAQADELADLKAQLEVLTTPAVEPDVPAPPL